MNIILLVNLIFFSFDTKIIYLNKLIKINKKIYIAFYLILKVKLKFVFRNPVT